MPTHTLSDLGWSPFFSSSFDSMNVNGLVPARVARAARERYLLLHDRGACHAVPAGRLRREAHGAGGLPVAGDWVVARIGSGLGHENHRDAAAPDEWLPDTARIEAVLPRRTLLTRLAPLGGGTRQALAANVDLVLLTAGLDHDFNPRRLERGALLAWEAGAEPVVVLTKADLRPDSGRELSQVMAAVPGARIVTCSALTGEGLGELRELLAPGLTAVLLGSSGTGKSTLVNRLLGYELQRTLEVRRADSRGRHATTHRELFLMRGGGLLMDTPGLRAFGLAGGEEMNDLFTDVEHFAGSCRYRDCRHEAEPGCGVKAAVERDELSAERYGSFLKLRLEAERLERRQANVPDLDRKRRERELGKLQKRCKLASPKR